MILKPFIHIKEILVNDFFGDSYWHAKTYFTQRGERDRSKGRHHVLESDSHLRNLIFKKQCGMLWTDTLGILSLRGICPPECVEAKDAYVFPMDWMEERVDIGFTKRYEQVSAGRNWRYHQILGAIKMAGDSWRHVYHLDKGNIRQVGREILEESVKTPKENKSILNICQAQILQSQWTTVAIS